MTKVATVNEQSGGGSRAKRTGRESLGMSAARVSEDYTVEIPRDVREALGLEPGQEVDFIRVGDSVRLIRRKGIHALRGILKGFDLSDYRDEEDRM